MAISSASFALVTIWDLAKHFAADDIKAYIPQYKRNIDIVHSWYVVLLHSCGAIFDVMDDLIDVAGIDAKHSNEDAILPFSAGWINTEIESAILARRYGYNLQQRRKMIYDYVKSYHKCVGKAA